MEKLRDESYAGSFGTFGGESNGQPQPQNTGGAVDRERKAIRDEARKYLTEVKASFQDQKEKYEEFLEVMKDYKAQRLDTDGVIARVKELFAGRNNLIFGFNFFLSDGYKITLDNGNPPPKIAVAIDEAF